jgi:predicted enzyme related to lactoylglutathione lyase
LLARSLIDAAELDARIGFYERLLGVPADLRMPIPDFGGLELAAIGGLLIIASERPFTPIQRRTAYSLIVPSLEDQLERLGALGAVVLEPPETIVPGSRARVRYPDGSVAELVEHRPRPGERPASASRPGSEDEPEPHEPAVRLLARRPVPRGDLGAALAFYALALDAPAEEIKPDELSVIGNLLLVASDAEDAKGPEFALLVGTHQEAGGLGPQIVTLPDGQQAEAWGTRDALPASIR